ncbi:class I SAM-dependent methyltransferase [Myceligenerans indicum]|uniref:Methyltransferase domain-containing protein n=1 Tax=Myceligenerans indicum TaxID=2593663 RepID=A0ABS1LKU7_9MICO|nr:class I SAM-dependent methyltransferase [Myceligenerans indicum]MBL0886774.1 methyltransferase domain-containing protein [Myceligenerans indicum]
MAGTQKAASVRRAYDTVAEDYAAYFHDARTDTPDNLAVIDAFADAVAAGPAPGSVLDAGCGSGRMSRYLAARGTAVRGLDLSPGMIAQASRAQPGVPFDVGTLTDLPYDDGEFAGVLLWYSIIHTPAHAQPAIFAEVRRVVRAGGWVLAGFQTGAGVRDVAPAYRRYGHDVELVRYPFTPDQVARWMSEAGLRETERHVQPPEDDASDGGCALLAVA